MLTGKTSHHLCFRINAEGTAIIVLSLLQFGFLVIALYCAVLLRYPKLIVSHLNSASVAKVLVVTFGGVLAVGFVLTGWRNPDHAYDHKKVAAMGISIAVMTIRLKHLVEAADSATNKLKSLPRETPLLFHAITLLLGSVVIVVLIIISSAPYLAPRSTSVRESAFDQAKICRLGERGDDCYCVLELTFDSRRFLQYDVQPCLGFSPEQPHMIFRAEGTRLHCCQRSKIATSHFFLGARATKQRYTACPKRSTTERQK